MAYRVSIGRRLIAFATFVAAVSLALVHASNAAELGATVTNVASLSHGPPGGRINADTPPASFIIEAARTPSTVAVLSLFTECAGRSTHNAEWLGVLANGWTGWRAGVSAS